MISADLHILYCSGGRQIEWIYIYIYIYKVIQERKQEQAIAQYNFFINHWCHLQKNTDERKIKYISYNSCRKTVSNDRRCNGSITVTTFPQTIICRSSFLPLISFLFFISVYLLLLYPINAAYCLSICTMNAPPAFVWSGYLFSFFLMEF